MPFLSRERALLDAKREADRQDDSQLLLMYATMLLGAVILILCIVMLAAANAAPEQPKPANTCKQAASWARWEALLEKYPDDPTLRKLYNLRVDLCTQVEAGELTIAEGTERFERERSALIQQAEQPRGGVQSQRDPQQLQ
jgi:hypothetical protein